MVLHIWCQAARCKTTSGRWYTPVATVVDRAARLIAITLSSKLRQMLNDMHQQPGLHAEDIEQLRGMQWALWIMFRTGMVLCDGFCH